MKVSKSSLLTSRLCGSCACMYLIIGHHWNGDKPWRRYVRRRLRNKREEVEVLENEIEAGDDVDLAVTNDG
ncbi:hypothetical protein DY000_02048555 [Brassica cretica]|uniref:Uncharacterized protein n=1 Tax=Brassica cretica TaxID=69181 RepID=A0ABQ7EQD9_BRACR|nr:hypothetical protein DY000_02048555 [Brassica cretica]